MGLNSCVIFVEECCLWYDLGYVYCFNIVLCADVWFVCFECWVLLMVSYLFDWTCVLFKICGLRLVWCLLICYFANLYLFCCFFLFGWFGLFLLLVFGLITAGLVVFASFVYYLWLFNSVVSFLWFLFSFVWYLLVCVRCLRYFVVVFAFASLWFALLNNCLHYHCSLCVCLILIIDCFVVAFMVVVGLIDLNFVGYLGV